VAIPGVQLAQALVILITAAALFMASFGLFALALQRCDRCGCTLLRFLAEPALMPMAEREARVRPRAGSLASLPTRAPPTFPQRRRCNPPGLIDRE